MCVSDVQATNARASIRFSRATKATAQCVSVCCRIMLASMGPKEEYIEPPIGLFKNFIVERKSAFNATVNNKFFKSSFLKFS